MLSFQLTGKEDDDFRRLLGIEKDVKLIDDVLELVCRDFENIKHVRRYLNTIEQFNRVYQGQQTRNQCGHLLNDLQARGERCRADLKTFESVTNNLNIDSNEKDALRKKKEVVALIQVN